ncbi:MAG: BREX-4 system phosphatase PglZ, partial [Desulfomonilaceae bacterium]
PLGEILRFFPHRADIIGALAELECNDTTRLFIPLLEVDHIFESAINKLNRYRSHELPQPLHVTGSSAISVEVTSFRAADPHGYQIDGVRAYLEHWEQGGSERISLVTRTPIAPVNIAGRFHLRVFSGPFDYLSSKRQLPAGCQPQWGLEDQWLWLIGKWREGESFTSLVQRLLGLTICDSKGLLRSWNDWSPNHQWLGWLWSKCTCREDTYLGLAVKDSDSATTLVDDLIQAGFDAVEDDEMLAQRRQLLKSVGPINYPDTFWPRWQSLRSSIDKLKLLVGATKAEKLEIAKLTRVLVESRQNQDDWLPYLASIFPELYYYLTEFPFDDDSLIEYFALYNRSKILDDAPPELLELARRFAIEHFLWKFPTRESELEHLRGPTVKVLWIDGLGLEWAGLIRQKLSDQSGMLVELKVGRAALPTITACNLERGRDNEVNHGLDQIAHAYDYSYPDTLLKEIDVVTEIVGAILDLLDKHSRVVVTSDHGLSRSVLHKTRDSQETPQGCQVKRWGRYAEMQNNATPDERALAGCLVDNGRVILAHHGRFAGGWGPAKEIHGGATLEEALVPIFVITRRHTQAAQMPLDPSSIQLLSETVRLDVKGAGLLKIRIPRPLEKLDLRIGTAPVEGGRISESEWHFEVRGLQPGNVRAVLETEGTRLCEISFTAIRGMTEKDLGI